MMVVLSKTRCGGKDGLSRGCAKGLQENLRISFKTEELSSNRAPLSFTRMPPTGLTLNLNKGGLLARLSSTLPALFLGPRAPKPCGTLRTQGGERALVWDPTKPLPPLHENSWEVTRADALHLLSHGEEGVQVRVVQPREVFKLLGGRGWHASERCSAGCSRPSRCPPLRSRFLCCSVGWVGFPCV